MNRRKIISKNLLCVLVIFTGLILMISTAKATVWQVDATTTNSEVVSNFWVRFDDTGTPNVVELGDFVSWSGVTYTQPNPDEFYDILEGIPELTIDGLTLTATVYENSDYWTFKRDTSIWYVPDKDEWTYNATVVPIPGAVWLLGSGLIGVVGVRRKFKT